MRKVKLRGLRLALGAATLGSVGVLGTLGSGTASASTPRHDHGSDAVVGRVYVNDNTVGVNTVGGFNRLASGALTPLPSSPFAVGGAGTGAGLPSQGAIQLSSNGHYLLVADAGSNQISVVRIERDGSLQIAGGGPVWSNGPSPVSIAVFHKLVYVANSGTTSDPNPNYTGFTLHHGNLTAIPGSTVSLPAGSLPGDVLFNGNGTKLVGTRIGTSKIDSFTVGADRLLTAAPGSPFAAQGLGPFGSEFRPTNSSQLFVSNAHNVGALTGTISAYNDSADGTLSSIGSSPFADLQTAPCWVEITHDGRFLFTVNTGSGSISRYSIASGGALTLLGSTPVSATGGVGAVDARLSPDGRTLFVDESRIGAVGSFAVKGGNLAELPGSPTSLPTGATPAGIVVTSN